MEKTLTNVLRIVNELTSLREALRNDINTFIANHGAVVLNSSHEVMNSIVCEVVLPSQGNMPVPAFVEKIYNIGTETIVEVKAKIGEQVVFQTVQLKDIVNPEVIGSYIRGLGAE